jgi:hypothetical protein
MTNTISKKLPVAVNNPNVMLTVILKHHAGLTLEDIQTKLKDSQWWDRFPPNEVKIVSWTVAMGLGQILTLELPPHLLPIVNVELERSAWGVFKTDCYPTYDFLPARERIRDRVRAGGK